MGLTCGYHCTAKPVSFGKGQSAVHTAAYNARQQLYQELEGRSTRNYSSHDGEVLFSGIFAPKDAPDWAHDRQELWNRAEAAERQKVNGQPARNMIVAFPHELDQQQREWMLKDFARGDFARRGMIADVSMHAPDEHGDQRNYHAHILVTMRQLDGDEFAKTKCREWNSKAQLEAWREGWAEKGAHALERAGFPAEAERWRHGHETLEVQRAAAIERGDQAFADSLHDREATMHKGPKISGMERKGLDGSDRLDALKSILERNELRFEIKALDGELKALEAVQAQHEPAMRDPAPKPFGDAARDEGQQARQERHDEKFRADQAAWRESVSDRQPGKTSISGKGFEVVDGATGAVSNLGDFMLGLMAGSSGRAQPEQAPAPSMQEFLNNPAARAAHQRAGAAKAIEEREDILALHRIGQDVLNGRKLKAEDIQSLTHEHQQSIHLRGDDRIRELVEEARKRARDDGRERE